MDTTCGHFRRAIFRVPTETLYDIIALLVTEDIDLFLLPVTVHRYEGPLHTGFANTQKLLRVSERFRDVTLKVWHNAVFGPRETGTGIPDGQQLRGQLERLISDHSTPFSEIPLTDLDPQTANFAKITGFRSPLLQAYSLVERKRRRSKAHELEPVERSAFLDPDSESLVHSQSRRISHSYYECASAAVEAIRPPILGTFCRKFRIPNEEYEASSAQIEFSEIVAAARAEPMSNMWCPYEETVRFYTPTIRACTEPFIRLVKASPSMAGYGRPEFASTLRSLAKFDTDAIATISASLPLTDPIPEEVINADKLLKEQIQAWFECAQQGLGDWCAHLFE